MKLKIIICIISALAFLNANAHNPNSDNLCVYIDNIFIGKRCCVDYDKILSVFLENYYCNYLFKCSPAKPSVNDPFPSVNPKAIKHLFIEKGDMLSTNSILHIRTKKAKDGFLFVNKCIMDKVANLNCESDKMEVLYVYNNKAVRTKKDVMRVLRLREKCIQISEITQDEQLGIITVYIIDK
ncbi:MULTISPECIES: hypothetical protein [Bacteroidales]|uniref:Uncharacterized protein n=1 Tax=Porphyromonas loveana TaxID=1884669 RepID=A0A2U1F762_9PORP|nr:hypothetical protein [Porphyromonas loveana]PVZ07800.1 hypothetical protein C7382_11819 [Porphyromonas loveana]